MFIINKKTMKKIILLTLITFLFIGCTAEKQTDAYTNTTVEGLEAIDKLEQQVAETKKKNNTYVDIHTQPAYEFINKYDDTVVLDVSPKYDEGHLPNAINYYVGDGSLDEAIPTLDKTKTYLVYCHVDSAAITGAQALIDAGVETVYRLEGNYSAWEEGGYPVEIMVDQVGDVSGTVKATRSTLDSEFQHTVTANIDDPAEDKFYEGWLVTGTDFFSTGKLEKNGEAYYLEYESAEDQSAYNEVVITLETLADGLDNKPEAHIFEGEF